MPALRVVADGKADQGMTQEVLTELLESLLPFVMFAHSHGLPNADHYVKLIESFLWPQK